MTTILSRLADAAAQRVREDKARISAEDMRGAALAMGPGGGAAFSAALSRGGISFICEIKKASPSRGIISGDFPYLRIAEDYGAAGADALSCLTEPRWFLGSDGIFREVRERTSLPMLRKDFTVDDYQLYQSRTMGADAVLLIAALHTEGDLVRRLELCDRLGLAALVETHDEQEIGLAVSCGAKLIGVNNRNLKDFTVDLGNAARLREKIPEGTLFVAESGVRTPEDVRMLARIGADAALIGEALMTAPDRQAALRAFREAAQ